jgi:hypothetical protein
MQTVSAPARGWRSRPGQAARSSRSRSASSGWTRPIRTRSPFHWWSVMPGLCVVDPSGQKICGLPSMGSLLLSAKSFATSARGLERNQSSRTASLVDVGVTYTRGSECVPQAGLDGDVNRVAEEREPQGVVDVLRGPCAVQAAGRGDELECRQEGRGPGIVAIGVEQFWLVTGQRGGLGGHDRSRRSPAIDPFQRPGPGRENDVQAVTGAGCAQAMYGDQRPGAVDVGPDVDRHRCHGVPFRLRCGPPRVPPRTVPRTGRGGRPGSGRMRV